MSKLHIFIIVLVVAFVAISDAEPSPPKTKGTKQASSRILSAEEANQLVVHQRYPEYPYHARSLGLTGSGLFILHIRPNGTVSSVQIFKSTGHKELDDRCIAAFSEWRFRPGVAKKAKIPVSFTMRY